MRSALIMAAIVFLALAMIYGAGHHAHYLDNSELLQHWRRHF